MLMLMLVRAVVIMHVMVAVVGEVLIGACLGSHGCAA